MVICLGIFVFPKQGFFSDTKMDCCSAQTEQMDCCNEEHENNGQNSSDCGAGSCTSCHTCSISFFASITAPAQETVTAPKIAEQKPMFSNIQSSDSSGLKEIWQPPKIS